MPLYFTSSAQLGRLVPGPLLLFAGGEMGAWFHRGVSPLLNLRHIYQVFINLLS
jgi:hypothetical protein